MLLQQRGARAARQLQAGRRDHRTRQPALNGSWQRQRRWHAAAADAAAADAAAAAAEQAQQQQPQPDVLFQALAASCNIDASALQLRAAGRDRGAGLFAAAPLPAGATLLRVPRSLCIVIDNEAGSMTIPSGEWPRLSGGLMQDNALTWDVLQGLAMMDAIAGDGDQFWEVYAEELLPQPEQLMLPMCWDEPLLQQLQHPAIIAAAQEQQERLRSLLPPAYMAPIEPGSPSYLQWGFGVVRSRAIQLGASAFGLAPFLDFANHAQPPNADLRLLPPPGAAGGDSAQPAATGEASDPAAAQGFVELVALKDVAAGEEVTLCYSGDGDGYTNQRLMAQYGFVPTGGNAADRLQLDVPERLAGATLRLSHVEEALGAGLLMQAARGENPYLFAALKSLPLTADEVDEAQQAAAAPAGAPAGADAAAGRGIGPATQQEQELAAALLEQVQAEVAASGSSLEDDEALLQQLMLVAAGQQPDATAAAAAAAAGVAPGDVRLKAAVRYRVERKRLLQAASVLLSVYVRA